MVLQLSQSLALQTRKERPSTHGEVDVVDVLNDHMDASKYFGGLPAQRLLCNSLPAGAGAHMRSSVGNCMPAAETSLH